MQIISNEDNLHEMSNCVYWKKGRKLIILLSAELVKVNKCISQGYSGHMMTCEQKSGVPRNLNAKEEWILHKLLAT